MKSKWAFIGVAIGLCLTGAIWRVHRVRRRSQQARNWMKRVTQHDYGPPKIVPSSCLQALPACVQRFFKYTLESGQAVVVCAHVQQTGRIRLGGPEWTWCPFSATQVIFTQPGGFVWNAEIRLPLGLSVQVRDSYLGFEGRTEAEAFSFFKLADVSGCHEVSSAALMRFLAEAVWYPTALLPCNGVTWTERSQNSAVAKLRDGSNEAELEFHFAPDGRVLRVFSPGRYRLEKGRFELTPWEAFLSGYEKKQGMMIPTQASVGWHLNGGFVSVWEGRLASIEYEFGRF